MRTNNKITLRVGSYNIKAGSLVGFDMSKLAAEIESQWLEIVGLQEVDHGTARSGGIDTMKLLAGAAVYGHYKFARAILQRRRVRHGNSEQIPDCLFEVIPFYSGERRGPVCRTRGCRGQRPASTFSTRISHESAELRRVPAKLAELTKKCTYVLTGTNTAECREFSVFENSILSILTHIPPSLSCRGIDNIVPGQLALTARMGAPGNSDHNPVGRDWR